MIKNMHIYYYQNNICVLKMSGYVEIADWEESDKY